MPKSMREIFVFGSNLLGIYGKGAALHALKHHGTVKGRGRGLQGNSYAIPTKLNPGTSLSIFEINSYVAEFLKDAHYNSEDHIFMVTPIGCGLAGYSPEDIAPMFHLATHLPNVRLPREFVPYLPEYPVELIANFI